MVKEYHWSVQSSPRGREFGIDDGLQLGLFS
jgi:hypothetical protein